MVVIITIMVLEFKVPHDTSWQSLWQLWPLFISYALIAMLCIPGMASFLLIIISLLWFVPSNRLGVESF